MSIACGIKYNVVSSMWYQIGFSARGHIFSINCRNHTGLSRNAPPPSGSLISFKIISETVGRGGGGGVGLTALVSEPGVGREVLSYLRSWSGTTPTHAPKYVLKNKFGFPWFPSTCYCISTYHATLELARVSKMLVFFSLGISELYFVWSKVGPGH